jgi:hypothetical protein
MRLGCVQQDDDDVFVSAVVKPKQARRRRGRAGWAEATGAGQGNTTEARHGRSEGKEPMRGEILTMCRDDECYNGLQWMGGRAGPRAVVDREH